MSEVIWDSSGTLYIEPSTNLRIAFLPYLLLVTFGLSTSQGMFANSPGLVDGLPLHYALLI